MVSFPKEKLARWTRGEWVNSDRDTEIAGFSIDSRNIDRKEMFIAVRSERRDGHAFVADAERRGASAALTEEYVPHAGIPQLKVKQGVAALQSIAHQHRLTFSGPVVGITGSCGKTSTKDLLAFLLGESKVLKTAGNLNNYLGVPLTLLRLDNERHDFGVIEAGINQRDEMADLANIIDADFGIVTMIGHAHLELLENLDGVAREKSNLLRFGRSKQGIIYPVSCLRYAAFRDLRDTVNHVVTPLGQQVPELEWIKPVYYWCLLDDSNRWNLFLSGNDGVQRRFFIPNMSPGMRQNLALAILTASEMGVDDATMQLRLLRWYPSDNRGQVLRCERSWLYSDCYNANPDSMRDSLSAFESTFDAALPRLYVLGSMYELGPDAPAFHRSITGRIRARNIDRFVFVGKYASDYREGLAYNGFSLDQVECFENAEQAKATVHAFEGAVFLKGSRLNRLETLIPPSAEKIVLDSGRLC
jgi:UDP-N-acetylmuramoyl-tripeptide--D-alanyl-D-alanine ligase